METREGIQINPEGKIKATILQRETAFLMADLIWLDHFKHPDPVFVNNLQKKLPPEISIEDFTLREAIQRGHAIVQQKRIFSQVCTALDRDPADYLLEYIGDSINALNSTPQAETNTEKNQRFEERLNSIAKKVKGKEIKFPVCDTIKSQRALDQLIRIEKNNTKKIIPFPGSTPSQPPQK